MRRIKFNKGTIFIYSVTLVPTIILWLNYGFHFLDLPIQFSFPFVEIIYTSGTCLILLSNFKDKKIAKVLAVIFAIPLLPFMVIGILSQTKPLASLTLPLMVLPLVAIFSTYAFNLLMLLDFGEKFETFTIPYLNLTSIIIIFSFFDRLLVKMAARFIPESQMPSTVKGWTYELLDKRIFYRLSYLILTVLLVITTIEKLSEITIIESFFAYKSVVVESLLTFVAVDRLASKWKIKVAINN